MRAFYHFPPRPLWSIPWDEARQAARAYNDRGIVYYTKGDFDQAIADFNEALRLDPNDPDVYNNRGLAYAGKGDYDRAIADYNEAIQLDPNDPDVYNNRGLAYAGKEDYARARADWEKALQLDPDNTNARDDLEMLLDMGY